MGILADCGLLSVDSLADPASITLPGGQPPEFILPLPGGRRFGEFVEQPQDLRDAAAAQVTETMSYSEWEAQLSAKTTTTLEASQSARSRLVIDRVLSPPRHRESRRCSGCGRWPPAGVLTLIDTKLSFGIATKA